MKRLLICLAAIAIVLSEGHGQNSDDQYLQIYSLIQEADALSDEQPARALAKYIEAQSALQKFQRLYPDWNPKIISFRLNSVGAKVNALSGKVPLESLPASGKTETKPPATPATSAKPAALADLEQQLASANAQVQQLQAEKGVLQAKLKEALSIQPAALDPGELVKAEEQIRSLQKENDLLKVSLAEEQAKGRPPSDPKSLEQAKQALADTKRQLTEETARTKTLEDEKKVLQAQLRNAPTAAPDPKATAETKAALDEADRKLKEQTELASKLQLEKEALQSKLRSTSPPVETGSAETLAALRTENDALKKRLAESKPDASSGDAARQLAQARAQIAALESEKETLRLEKVALQNRTTPTTTVGALPGSSPARPEDASRIKDLERERDDLLRKLEVTQKEVSGRKSKAAAARVDELADEMALLRARLAVFEARAVPYTAEELAFFKPGEPRLAAMDKAAGKKSIRELPSGTAALVAEAQRDFNARRFEMAEQKYLQVLKQDDSNPYTLANLAAIQLELNHLDEAEKHVKQAIALIPDDAYSQSILGYLKFRQAKYDEALNALSKAAQLNPKSAEIQNYLGLTLGQKGMRGPAETALRKAIQLEPNYPAAHNNLAVIYASQQPPLVELARWHYQKALAAGHAKNPDLEKMLSPKESGSGNR
jgi:tetratricopeptide (TPR) repeat protein